MRKSITLKDIAEKLNVSTTTVSKALKDYPDISQKTKDRVKELVNELGYAPNSLIASLNKNKYGVIAVIVPEIIHQFFAQTVSTILVDAQKRGCSVLIYQSLESYAKEVEHCKTIERIGVSGLLISLSNETDNVEHIQRLIDKGVKVVQFDKISHELDTPKVAINDYKAAYEITEFLIKKNRKKICQIVGPIIPRNAKDRLKGYRDALIKNNLNFNSDRVYRSDKNSDINGYKYAQEILKDFPDTDAIFCYSDLLAIGAMRALHEVGKKIPEDVATVGFSNWYISRFVTPSLTTCDQPADEIGRTALNTLFDLMDGKSEAKENKKIIIPTQMILRESTG